MDGVVAYILGKSYTKKSLIGIGALAGAPCEVQSINKVGKTTTVTLKWEDNVGGVHTQSFDVEDGADGVSVVGATINPTGNLILTLSDTNTIDCGKVLPQYDTMPTPSASNVGQILQYIGTTSGSYTKGYFYECVESPVGSGTYIWQYINVQDSYTKSEIGVLSDLPDNTKNVVQNITQLKLSIDQLQASKLSISDIDNALSLSSENPVQNKIITGALNDKEDKFRVTVMPIITADDVGKIVQYIGNTTSALTKGYFYIATEISTGVYDWVQKNVQPSGGSTGGDGVVDGYYNPTDHLFYEEAGYINPVIGESDTLYVSLDTNLLYRYNGLIFIRVDETTSGEDDVIDGYYNTIDHKFYEEPTYVTEITGETGKIYISDDTNIQYRWDGTQFVTISSSIEVDNALSTTSENPVQNKVITLGLNQLQGSLANKVDKEAGKGLSSNDFTDADKEKVVNLAPIYLIGSGLALNPTDGTLSATGISIQVDPTLDTTSTHPIQNQAVANAIDQLQASKLSISDIDNALSTTSENPVQNKVISLAIDQLQGSVLGKMQKRLAATADNFAIFDNNGEVDDSGISKNIVPSTASSSNKLLVASDLSAKADKVSGATNGNIAGLDASGNLTDSGIASTDVVVKSATAGLIKNDGSIDVNVYITNGIATADVNANNVTISADNKWGIFAYSGVVSDVINYPLAESYTPYSTARKYAITVIRETDTLHQICDVSYLKAANDWVTDRFIRTAEWNGTSFVWGNWDKIVNAHDVTTATDILAAVIAHRAKEDALTNAFSELTNYSIGDYVTYLGDLYVFTSNHSASAWDASDVVKTNVLSLLDNKADKVSSATANDFATLDANGNLTDSGINKNIVPSSASSSNKLATANDIPDELNDLDDVVISGTPSNAQILAYNSTSGKWENQTGQSVIGGTTFKGSILFANLPTTGMANGDWYDIKDAFTTDSRFEEGSGVPCAAGTDVIWVDSDSKWNILTPSGVYSFNGRTGAVVPAQSDYDASDIDYTNTTSGLSATDVQSAIDEVVSNKADKVASPTSGNFAGLDANGNLTDSGSKASDFLTSSDINGKADKVSSPTNGDLAGLDANGNLTDSGILASKVIQKVTTATGLLKDDGTVDTTTYAPSNKAYLTDDAAETTIDDTDYVPFYDTSATAKRKSLWSNIKSVLKTYFDSLYAGKSVVSKTANGLAPQLPNETTTTKFLRQDGSWEVPNYPTVPTAYTSNPAMDGVASAGSSANWAKGDHVHPSDTNKADVLDLAPAFNSANAYAIGAYVTYTDGNMYKFTSAHTAGDPWSSSEVTQVTVGSELSSASSVDIKPPVSPTPTESTVVSALTTGTSSASTEAASAYAVQQWSNSDTKRFTRTITASASGITGIGDWDDTTNEADWWQDDAFKLPDSANSKNIDIAFKFDPQVNNGEVVVLGGYILDTTTGKLCIKFANTVYNAQLIAVDITYTRNNYS